MRIACTIFCLALLSPAGLMSATPTTLPADPPVEKAERIRAWLVGLTHADPGVRDESQYELMGLGRADLPLLRSAAERYRPLDRALLERLHDIVTHAYMAEDPFPKRTDDGFLGVDLPPSMELTRDPRLTIEIRSRMKGFCGYRALRDGDVIVDIDEAPLPARVTAPDMLLTAFIHAIKSRQPGEVIHLRVLRQGKLQRIGVKLDGRPAPEDDIDLTAAEVAAMRARRESSAQKYWEAEFEPRLTAKPLPAMSY